MIKCEKIDKKEWEAMSSAAHLIVFGESRPAFLDRIDFAYLFTREEDGLLAYATVRELDGETVYWAHGGSFPNAKGTTASFACYSRLIEQCFADGYKQVFTYIKNTNIVMLKFAFKIGFIVTGIKTFEGEVFLELLNKKGQSGE